MIKVHPNVKFSYNITRGTSESKKQIVSSLNEKFFDSFQSAFAQKKVRLQDLRRIYQELLPENKKIEIKKLKGSENAYGASDYVYDDNDNIIGVTLELPVEKSKLVPEIIPTIMHENTHILLTLLEPKQTALTQKLHLNGKFNGSYNKWYNDFIYGSTETTECSSKEALKEKITQATKRIFANSTIKDRILLLQDARYQLQQEQEAFREQLKYANRIAKSGGNIYKEDLIDEEKKFFIAEKINILKEMISELAQKRRKRKTK